MKYPKYLIALLLTCLSINAADYLSNISVSPFAAFRNDLNGNWDHGAGLDVGYQFSKHVGLHGRAIAYSNDDWRGSAIDEVSGLVSARLFKSGGATLNAIGGVDGDIAREDVGLSAGLNAALALSKNVSVFAEGRYRLWRDGGDDLPALAGLRFSF
jgi:hypothetical protein